MSPTTAATGSGGKRRQPLPREWGVGSSSSNGRFSAEPPTSPPQHDTSPNKRHSLAGSTASTSSTSFAGSSRGHAHSNSTSSTSTIGSTVQGREQRASTVRDLTRRHQARYYSEDLGNHSINGGEGDEQRERRQSLRAGSAESALGNAVGGRSLIGEGLRAAGLTGRVDRMGGGDVFQERTPARVEWADGQRSRSVSRQGGALGNGHGRAATSLDYTAYDRDDGDEPRTAPLLRTYRSSAHVLESAGARAGSAQGRYPDRGMSVERDLRDDRERERHAAPSPSPFGSVASRRHGSGGGGSGQHEHTRLMVDSLAMFEGHLARVGGTGDRTAQDLAQSAQKLVNTAERLNAILRAGTKQALEEQIDAEVSGVDSSGGGGADAQDLAEVWRRVGGEYREGLRVSDELVRSVTGLLLGVGRVVRDFGEGRGSDEGRNSASPDAGRRSVESRRSLDKDERRISAGGRDSALGVRPSSVLNTRHEPTPPSIPRTGTPASRRLLTPREQRELQASAGLVASDSQETVQPKKRDDDYEPSPTPASRKQNQSTLDRSRTLPPISIPKPLPTLPSESASTLRRNQTTGNSSQRRRTITSSTVRAPGGLLHSATPTTALTPHTVSNSPNELRGSEARMSFPSLPRSDSDKSVPPTRSRNNTVTFSRPSNVALAGLQMQHDRERQRTISNSNNQFDAAAIASAAAAGPSSRSDGEKVTPGKRSTLAVRDRPRASLDGGDSVGPSHAADRSAAAGLSTLGQKRERRRTVTDIWPPNGS
ncbi:hypothetical protein R3P38DRAFT_2871443 [Favolaschia claudopus]|uniref:Uncharacterized protein n=1 Tax=Favolaschia claudopus TaxID=2862362 RepID=A0AAW0D8A1_9AGAR